MSNFEDDELKVVIQPMQFQYAVPKKYNGKTKDANYVIETEWHKYFAVEMYKNYFIEDELEFFKALKNDLEKQLMQVDSLIEKEERLLAKQK